MIGQGGDKSAYAEGFVALEPKWMAQMLATVVTRKSSLGQDGPSLSRALAHFFQDFYLLRS